MKTHAVFTKVVITRDRSVRSSSFIPHLKGLLIPFLAMGRKIDPDRILNYLSEIRTCETITEVVITQDRSARSSKFMDHLKGLFIPDLAMGREIDPDSILD